LEDEVCTRPHAAALPQGQSVAGRAEEVRRVYARWERGALSNVAFREQLQGLSLNHHEVRAHETVDAGSNFIADDCRSRQPDGPSTSLRQVICAFVDGQLPAVSFRQQLRQHGVQSLPELERLIRTHESDNNVRFGDFARVLMRQLPNFDMSAAKLADVEIGESTQTRSVPGTPSSTRMGTSGGGGSHAGRCQGNVGGRSPPFAAGAECFDDAASVRSDSTFRSRGAGSQRPSSQGGNRPRSQCGSMASEPHQANCASSVTRSAMSHCSHMHQIQTRLVCPLHGSEKHRNPAPQALHAYKATVATSLGGVALRTRGRQRHFGGHRRTSLVGATQCHPRHLDAARGSREGASSRWDHPQGSTRPLGGNQTSMAPRQLR